MTASVSASFDPRAATAERRSVRDVRWWRCEGRSAAFERDLGVGRPACRARQPCRISGDGGTPSCGGASIRSDAGVGFDWELQTARSDRERKQQRTGLTLPSGMCRPVAAHPRHSKGVRKSHNMQTGGPIGGTQGSLQAAETP